MSTYYKFDNPTYLYWPEFPGLAAVTVARSKRKTTELSMIPHKAQMVIKAPHDLSGEDLHRLVFKHADSFKESIITTARFKAE